MVASQLRRRLAIGSCAVALIAPTSLGKPPQTDDGTGPLAVPRVLPDVKSLPSIEVDPSLRELARQLGDPSYSNREQAMDALLDGTVEPGQLCAILTESSLTAEQRYRLLMVLETTLIDTPRGAIGIGMDWMQRSPREPGEVVIVQLVPGLPAERVLQLGDRITHVDARALYSSTDLIILVQTKRPGDEVSLRVRRPRHDEQGRPLLTGNQPDYETIDLSLHLGSTSDLDDEGQSGGAGRVLQGRLQETAEARRMFAPRPHPVVIPQVSAVP